MFTSPLAESLAPDVLERFLRYVRVDTQSARGGRPIRSGTDGSILSSMGLPTPNRFTGGHEFHSPREWASVQEMAAAAATVVRLAAEWAHTPWTSTSPTTTS